MAQHFELPAEPRTGNADPAPRAQRMTADESRAVIALWQSERVEQTGLTDKPAVPNVAEGLEVSVEDVQRLLTEVRARRVEEERTLIAEQELSEIRLAEEERKLAEVRRQRAELRREQSGAERNGVSQTISAHQRVAETKTLTEEEIKKRADKAFWQLVAFILIVTVLFFAWATLVGGHPNLNNAPCSINNQPATAEDCQAINRGDYSPMIKYMPNDNK